MCVCIVIVLLLLLFFYIVCVVIVCVVLCVGIEGEKREGRDRGERAEEGRRRGRGDGGKTENNVCEREKVKKTKIISTTHTQYTSAQYNIHIKTQITQDKTVTIIIHAEMIPNKVKKMNVTTGRGITRTPIKSKERCRETRGYTHCKYEDKQCVNKHSVKRDIHKERATHRDTHTDKEKNTRALHLNPCTTPATVTILEGGSFPIAAA